MSSLLALAFLPFQRATSRKWSPAARQPGPLRLGCRATPGLDAANALMRNRFLFHSVEYWFGHVETMRAFPLADLRRTWANWLTATVVPSLSSIAK